MKNKTKQTRKWTEAEHTALSPVILNTILLAVWIVNLFLALFQNDTPNILAALAMLACIVFVIERLSRSVQFFIDARNKALQNIAEQDDEEDEQVNI